jgi:hypothetical protein
MLTMHYIFYVIRFLNYLVSFGGVGDVHDLCLCVICSVPTERPVPALLLLA